MACVQVFFLNLTLCMTKLYFTDNSNLNNFKWFGIPLAKIVEIHKWLQRAGSN
jgi:hypothetical protein